MRDLSTNLHECEQEHDPHFEAHLLREFNLPQVNERRRNIDLPTVSMCALSRCYPLTKSVHMLETICAYSVTVPTISGQHSGTISGFQRK
jgi:hypothetical protein